MRVACFWFHEPAATSKIAEMFLRFSPQICIKKDRAIFVEIGKCSSLYSEESFINRANYVLKKSNLNARIRIGNDITDSLALARSGASSVDRLPLEYIMDFADPFERDEALRKSVQKLVSSFQDLGIKSLEQFKRLDVGQLVTRFGTVGRFCHQRIKMESPIGWPNWEPEEIIFEDKNFPYFEFYGELDPILFELKTQLDQIFLRLFARKKRIMKLQIQVRCEKVSTDPNPVRTMDFDFFAPQTSVKGTLKILKERLTREFEKRPILSPIEGLKTTVNKTVPWDHSQRNIFNNDEEKFEQLYSVHNQMIELLGKENVYQVDLVEDIRPEKSWTKNFGAPHAPSEAKIDISIVPERPTYLCKRPIKVEVTAGYIHIGKRRRRIVSWESFPERIKGGWKESKTEDLKDSFDRSYFFVEIEGKQRIFVFETKEKEFFLHGYYG